MFNVTRDLEPPESLARFKGWRGEDVLKSLESIFFGKCYLCETKGLICLNVEHFSAHMDDEKKQHDWNNLFYVCTRCNNFKGHYYNDLIDCTDPSVDALRLIRHVVPATPFSGSITIQATNDEPRTVKTAELIRRIFNEENTGNKMVSLVSLKKKVFVQYSKLVKYMNMYADEDSTMQSRADAIEGIRRLMSKELAYSAFLRWAILESPCLLEQVENSID